MPASNTGGVKKKTALLGASPYGDLEQQTVEDTTPSFCQTRPLIQVPCLPRSKRGTDLSPEFVIATEDIEGEFMTMKDSIQKYVCPQI